jgi:hypothetical protein
LTLAEGLAIIIKNLAKDFFKNEKLTETLEIFAGSDG